ncbi:glutamate synthase subunit beta [Fulvivirga sedimenti]|uniref:Glutamate synthase subunit beta n=1 Tax=Fulvivirga sedimenti TaxID=2879465 RepID=A0A9X1HYY1_9BACT|nr:glutamate synthase subunit beta [Fulvivirga sedimenti]MCA6079004.1 glutamate synthase subunit beta [Fulvivirga sedimenti]
MGHADGFLKFNRELPHSRDPKVRIGDYKEIYEPFPETKTKEQAARCMDCGIPFCHNGCPLGNIIPDFNDAVYNEQWEKAATILLSTNNFPEFTGRICPAPCEASCVLGINKPPVAIEHIEKTIAEKAFETGLIKPQLPEFRTGKKVAVVGSGPAGLAAAAQLNKAGHWVTVFERSDRIGGLLRYGIPDFKLEKWVVDRRVKIMEEEGIRFKVNADIGININPDELLEDFDILLMCTGATKPRDLSIEGRELDGVHFAMDFLSLQNKEVAGDDAPEVTIKATGKHVIVIGGGDTGSDCIGTSHRQGAASVTQLELLPKPPSQRDADQNPWPEWPTVVRTSSSHEEGGERAWSMLTRKFIDNGDGTVSGLEVVEIEWFTDDKGNRTFREKEGSERILPCDLALLAIGFVSPERELPDQLKLETDPRGNIKTKKYRTSDPRIFAAGDARRGQSLVVWAIAEGREAAAEVDKVLSVSGQSRLERRDRSYLSL